MPTHDDRVARWAAWCAFVLGGASAAVSLYWATGGSALLDTVGGSVERWGRQRSFAVFVVLVSVAVLKLLIAVAAPLTARTIDAPAWTAGRVPRLLSWVAATTLVVYGGVLTVGGLLVQSAVINPSLDADRHALAWHTWFWDPWFLLWGATFAVALWRTRS